MRQFTLELAANQGSSLEQADIFIPEWYFDWNVNEFNKTIAEEIPYNMVDTIDPKFKEYISRYADENNLPKKIALYHLGKTDKLDRNHDWVFEDSSTKKISSVARMLEQNDGTYAALGIQGTNGTMDYLDQINPKKSLLLLDGNYIQKPLPEDEFFFYHDHAVDMYSIDSVLKEMTDR